VLDAQDAALARLLAQAFDGQVVRLVEDTLARPRKAAAPVAYDFWRQFKLADELEEIRQHRPAAFRALPMAPDDDGPVADLGQTVVRGTPGAASGPPGRSGA
jgi:hypothetical protein